MANKQASSNKINLILIGCHAGCYLAGTAEIGSSFLPFFQLSLYFLSLPSLPTFSLYLLSLLSLFRLSSVFLSRPLSTPSSSKSTCPDSGAPLGACAVSRDRRCPSHLVRVRVGRTVLPVPRMLVQSMFALFLINSSLAGLHKST